MQAWNFKSALGHIGTALCVLALAASCGRYYTAEVAGYVKDSERATGINGAVVRMYSNEPQSADAKGFVIETASATSGGNAGYYNHRVIWQNPWPAFGAEGDTTSFWLGITHVDYLDAVVKIRGILSGTLNFVPDVTLFRAAFSVPSVSGRVVNPAGGGINGVRVVLDLASTDEVEDYVTVTTTIDGETGWYRFNDVSWRDDDAAGQGSDTENVAISVSDTTYESATIVAITIESGQEYRIQEVLPVTRIDSTSFSTTIVGRCLSRIVSASDIRDVPARGIEVTLRYTDDDGTHTLYDQTDANGSYSFLIQWTDSTPGDVVDGTPDATIPAGEDAIVVEIEFEAPFAGKSFTEADPDNRRVVKSWLDPNYVPDVLVAE